jgi:hypothetical protein
MIYTEAFAINAGGPSDATRFLSLELGEEIKGFLLWPGRRAGDAVFPDRAGGGLGLRRRHAARA